MQDNFGLNSSGNKLVGDLINPQACDRLENMITTSGGTIIFGGKVDRKKRFVENTIILNPKLNSALMTEEIFGPIMPILAFNTIEDVISQIN